MNNSINFYKNHYEPKSGSVLFKQNLKGIIFTYKDKQFNEILEFIGDFESDIIFENCKFDNDIKFLEAKFHGNVTFKNCTCNGEVLLSQSVEFKQELDIISFSIKRQFYIQGGVFNSVRLSLINYSVLKINGGEFKSFLIGYWGNATFKEVSINFHILKGNITISGEKTFIEKLLLTQAAIDCSITVDNIQVNCINIMNFRNEKGLRLLNIKPFTYTENSNPLNKTEISIYNSYLGKGEFYSINFNQFENFYINNSHLTDCSFINIEWNFNIKAFKGRLMHIKDEELSFYDKIRKLEKNTNSEYSIFYFEESIIDYYLKLKETYRQIKYALSKQGDTINEQIFHSKEMLIYNRTLNPKNNLGTKLIIILSYILSDFGQSFSRPLIGLLIGHWILFFTLVFFDGIDNLYIDVLNCNIEGFKLGFYYYFKLINPLRKGDDLIGYYIIIDIMIRIWSSYMIYNIIRATRRFIK